MPWHSWHKRLEWLDKVPDTEQGEKHGEDEICKLAKRNSVRIKKLDHRAFSWFQTLRIHISKRNENRGSSKKEHK